MSAGTPRKGSSELLEHAQRIIARTESGKAVRLRKFVKGLKVTIVLRAPVGLLKDGVSTASNIVGGTVTEVHSDRITIQPDTYYDTTGVQMTFKKSKIETILGRPVKGGARKTRRRYRKRRTTRRR